jgi:hypothetical protein
MDGAGQAAVTIRAAGDDQREVAVSNDPGLDEAVDCLVKLYDADRNANIDAIRSKVRDCAARYEARFAKALPYDVDRRLADAFISQVQNTPLSRDIASAIMESPKEPAREEPAPTV